MTPIETLVSNVQDLISHHWTFQNLRFERTQYGRKDENMRARFQFNHCEVLVDDSGKMVIQSPRYRRVISHLDFPDSKGMTDRLHEVLSDFDSRFPHFTEKDDEDEFSWFRPLLRRYHQLSRAWKFFFLIVGFTLLFIIYRALPSLETWIKVPVLFVVIVAMSLLRKHLGF